MYVCALNKFTLGVSRTETRRLFQTHGDADKNRRETGLIRIDADVLDR